MSSLKSLIQTSRWLVQRSRESRAELKAGLAESRRLLEESRRILAKVQPKSAILGQTRPTNSEDVARR
jgi:hypothetical protein